MNFNEEDYERFLENIKNLYENNSHLVEEERMLSEREYVYILNELATAPRECPIVLGGPRKKQLEISKKELGERFYDFGVISSVSCNLNAVFNPAPSLQGTSTLNEIIRESVTNPHRIGDESAMGYAIVGGIDNINDLFVLKVPSEMSEGKDLYTERFVTEFGTNQMRNLGVPNFANTFGLVTCSRPIIDTRTKKVIEFCSAAVEQKVPYLIYENVGNSVSGFAYAEKANYYQILSLYLQVLISLSLANEICGLTHQDLHPGNILMRKIENVKGVFQIPYVQPDGTTVYVTADSVATIIDFGLSTIRYKGEIHGCIEPLPLYNGRYRDVSWPLHDAYKLLLFLANTCRNNKSVMTILRRIFEFFSSDDLLSAVDTQYELRYSLPYNEDTMKFTIRDLINHVLTKCEGNKIVSREKKTNMKLLDCKECGKMSLIEGTKRQINIPDTFNEFYDFYPYIKRRYPHVIDLIKKNFNYEIAKEKYNKHIILLHSDTMLLVKQYTPLNLIDSEILTYKTMSLVQEDNYRIFDLINKIERLSFAVKVGDWMADFFSDVYLKEEISQISHDVKSFLDKLCQQISSSKTNYNQISQVLSLPTSKEIISKDKRLNWYFTNASKINMVFDTVCQKNVLQPQINQHSKHENYKSKKMKVFQRYGLN